MKRVPFIYHFLDYDLNALHNAQLNEVDIPHLQTEIIDYLLALKENETEKSIEVAIFS
jgi:hypothetical protein